jgi:competence protein ComEC
MRRSVLIAIVLAVFGLLVFREWSLLPDGKLHMVFLDVGQGDSTLITLPSGRQILVDGGPDWSTLREVSYFMPFFDRSIEMVSLSHPHLDHLASLPEVLRRYDVGILQIAGTAYNSGRYKALLSGALLTGTKTMLSHAGDSLDLGDGVMMDVLWPPKLPLPNADKNLNNASLVFVLTYKGRRALFSGDMEKPVEDVLLKAGVDLGADLLKVAHHGSRSSSSTGMILAIHPSIAIMSVGEGNSYHHPSPEIVKRYQDLGIELHRTDLEGNIEIVWE